MKKKKSTSKINAIGLSVATLTLSYSLMILSPGQFFFTASQMLASAVGASASVPENPYNAAAQALSQKEAELAQREAALESRVQATAQTPNKGTALALYSFGMSVVLFVLVGINFYLDKRRGGRRFIAIPERFSVDLRKRG